MSRDIRFYDTSALLNGYKQLFNGDEFFVISSITLYELENIKTSNKSEEIKRAARTVTKWLKNNLDRYEVWLYTTDLDYILEEYALPVNNDTKILACVADYDKKKRPDETVFITDDLSLFNMANLMLGNACVETLTEELQDKYTGYLELCPSKWELAELYQDPRKNIFNALENQYLIARDPEGELLDVRVWRNGEYKHISEPVFDSTWLGRVVPYKGDIYQKCLFDSLQNNTITMVRGVAGSGKSFVSLGFLFHKLEKHEIDKIAIFCNPLATMNSAKLGYTPGDLLSKILDTQIGNILISKLGDRIGVEQLVNDGKLVLLPLSNIRGFDTSGTRCGVYITEAQNLDRELMKLALQRVGEGSIMVIDGDDDTQVDLAAFAGENNGMKRVSKVFRGKDLYGEIKLEKIYRSRLAEIANLI